MKVKELIDYLLEMPPEAELVSEAPDHHYYSLHKGGLVFVVPTHSNPEFVESDVETDPDRIIGILLN